MMELLLERNTLWWQCPPVPNHKALAAALCITVHHEQTPCFFAYLATSPNHTQNALSITIHIDIDKVLRKSGSITQMFFSMFQVVFHFNIDQLYNSLAMVLAITFCHCYYYVDHMHRHQNMKNWFSPGAPVGRCPRHIGDKGAGRHLGNLWKHLGASGK